MADDVQQTSLTDATGGEEVLAGDWNDDKIDVMPDPLTDAMHRLQNAGHDYHTIRTFPVVTRDMGETPRISIVSLLRTTAWPKDSPVDADPPRVTIPVCSCQDFFHRRLPSEDDLADANPPLVEILFDTAHRCKHLKAAWPSIRDEVNPDEQDGIDDDTPIADDHD